MGQAGSLAESLGQVWTLWLSEEPTPSVQSRPVWLLPMAAAKQALCG